VVVEGTPFGRYRLVELLGREVWRAYDTGTERIVAVKVLPAHLIDDQNFQQRFRREARAAAGLDDPDVVPIYDFREIAGRLFVAMRAMRAVAQLGLRVSKQTSYGRLAFSSRYPPRPGGARKGSRPDQGSPTVGYLCSAGHSLGR
jgi:hypothetical protein